MAGVVVGLHAVGFFILLGLVAPHHYPLGRAAGFLVGTGLTAYTLGLRHAFDADHISAIDNTTRKLTSSEERPLTVGFWFSLGHSTVVFVLAFLFALGIRSLGGAVRHHGSALHGVSVLVGTGISAAFLYLIAALNLAILLGILKGVHEVRRGRADERELAGALAGGGIMSRFFGRMTRSVNRPWQMYPVGILFGLGFDTATEVALLFLAAGAAGVGLPFYAILCLPVLFAAGMSLLDALDGAIMSFAYGWAFSKPSRRVFYNLVITGLSVVVALLIATIELSGVVAEQLGARGSVWRWLETININTLGFIIVGLFVITWGLAVAVWRLGRLEERWSRHRRSLGAPGA
jgi:nickel/cobalt transporter (NiCoT) family protein